MARVGSFVKIEDIGPLAKVVEISTKARRKMVKLALDGEEFWMPARKVKTVRA